MKNFGHNSPVFMLLAFIGIHTKELIYQYFYTRQENGIWLRTK